MKRYLFFLIGVFAVLLGARPGFAQSCTAQAQCGAGLLCEDGTCQSVKTVLGSRGTIYWVNQAIGDDANMGTEARPWKTISRAAGKGVLKAGDAVIVRAGTYRELVRPRDGGNSASTRVTYAAYPGEQVVISGADVIPSNSNGGWVAAGSNAHGTIYRHAWAWPVHDPGDKYPSEPTTRRELIVANGKTLVPVYNLADLKPGHVYVNGNPRNPGSSPVSHVYVQLEGGGDPDDRVMEVAVREQAFAPLGAPGHPCGDQGYLRIIGFTFRHTANRLQQPALCPGSRGSLVEGITAEFTNAVGIKLIGPDHVLRHSKSVDNGQMGIGGANCHNCLVESNESARNNWKLYEPGWESGGGKFSSTRGATLRGNRYYDNKGPGIWFDIENTYNTIERNYVAGNWGSGIFIELHSDHNKIINNVVVGTLPVPFYDEGNQNISAGIKVTPSSFNFVAYNTVIRNWANGVRFAPDNRDNAEGNLFFNNLLIDNGMHDGSPGANSREIAVTIQRGEAPFQAGGNLYWPHTTTPTSSKHGFRGETGGKEAIRTNDLAQFHAYMNTDKTSALIDRTRPHIENKDTRDGWKLAAGSQASGRAVAVPDGWWGPVTEDFFGNPRPRSGGDVGAHQTGKGVSGGEETLAPSATTGAAVDVSSAKAVLQGSVNANNSPTTVRFEYGMSTAYGSTMEAGTLTGSTVQAVSATLTGLRSATTYHFRVVATSPVGTTYGENTTFTTVALKPGAMTEGAIEVTGTGFLLKGTVDPNNSPTLVRFEYGTSAAYGSTIEVGTLTGGTAQAVSATLTGLRSATTYHFRVVATSPVGTTYGENAFFLTPGGVVTPALVEQRLPLREGWNLVSSAVQPTKADFRTLLAGIAANLVAVEDGEGRSYAPGAGKHLLETWNAHQAYLVHMSAPDTLVVLGNRLAARDTRLALRAGWNLVSYLPGGAMDAPAALAGIAEDLVVAKDEAGGTYHPATGINTLGALQPGQGYRVYVKRPVTLVYPER